MTQPAAPEPQYGAPQYSAPQYGATGTGPSKTLSIISLIAGIVGLFVGTIFSIAAIVLGFMGRSREPQAKGFWLTGIILGFVGLVLGFIWIAIFVALVGAGAAAGTIPTN